MGTAAEIQAVMSDIAAHLTKTIAGLRVTAHPQNNFKMPSRGNMHGQMRLMSVSAPTVMGRNSMQEITILLSILLRSTISGDVAHVQRQLLGLASMDPASGLMRVLADSALTSQPRILDLEIEYGASVGDEIGTIVSGDIIAYA